MKIQSGRRMGLAVDSNWYKALQEHRLLKCGQKTDHPTDMFMATFESNDDNGMWVKPGEDFSDFSEGSLFVPWRYIVAAVLLGPDDEMTLTGFQRTVS